MITTEVADAIYEESKYKADEANAIYAMLFAVSGLLILFLIYLLNRQPFIDFLSGAVNQFFIEFPNFGPLTDQSMLKATLIYEGLVVFFVFTKIRSLIDQNFFPWTTKILLGNDFKKIQSLKSISISEVAILEPVITNATKKIKLAKISIDETNRENWNYKSTFLSYLIMLVSTLVVLVICGLILKLFS